MIVARRTAVLAASLALLAACGDGAPAAGGARGPYRGPLAGVVDAVDGGRAELPCEPVPEADRAGLASAGHTPVEVCRWSSADTANVALRAADSTVVSLIRLWTPVPLEVEQSYFSVAERLDRDWGAGQACPENQQKGVVGDRFYARAGANVRLFARGEQLVLDYELGEGGCRLKGKA